MAVLIEGNPYEVEELLPILLRVIDAEAAYRVAKEDVGDVDPSKAQKELEDALVELTRVREPLDEVARKYA